MGSSGGGAFLPGDPPPSTGQTLNQPQAFFSVQSVTATGATGTTAAALSFPGPVFVTATGASGAGVALVTGAALPGAAYVIKNNMTGALNIYAVGGTINGTTGTTAFTITATGNLTATVWCSSAGAWQAGGNT